MNNDNRKTHFIIVRLTEREYNIIIANKIRENKNISDYIRSILFKKITI